MVVVKLLSLSNKYASSDGENISKHAKCCQSIWLVSITVVHSKTSCGNDRALGTVFRGFSNRVIIFVVHF